MSGMTKGNEFAYKKESHLYRPGTYVGRSGGKNYKKFNQSFAGGLDFENQ